MIANFGKDIETMKESMLFFYPGTKGQIFKSCTTLIADKENKIIGSVCLNLEISDLLLAQSAIQQFTQYNTDKQSMSSPQNVLTKNVDEILTYYMNQCENLIGKPMPLMSKDEKIKALGYLDQRGIFKITKASNMLCDAFQISRFTLYNYLEEARNNLIA